MDPGAEDMKEALGIIWDSQVEMIQRTHDRGGPVIVPPRWEQVPEPYKHLFALNMMPHINGINMLMATIRAAIQRESN